MNLKRFMLAIASLAMLGAALASSASAAAVTGGEWYVEGTTLSGEEKVECVATGDLTLTATVAGSPVELTAEGVDCENATIYNEGGAGKDKGTLTFTGVTVKNIPTCTVKGGMITTNPLQTELYMDSSNTSITFDKVEPAAGFANFAVITLQGAECPVSGNKPFKGYFYGEAENLTGVSAAIQPLVFSSAVDATAGSALVVAGNPAHLSGTVDTYLASGKEFYAK